MRRTQLLAAASLALFAGGAGCGSATDVEGGEGFVADLSAASEMAASSGSPTATGAANLVLDKGFLTVTVSISGTLTSNVTMAHLHGPASTSQTAPIVLDLATPVTPVTTATRTGTIVSASYNLDRLPVGSASPLKIDASALVGHMRTGRAYVNVHTVLNPAGELRGQIRAH